MVPRVPKKEGFTFKIRTCAGLTSQRGRGGEVGRRKRKREGVGVGVYECCSEIGWHIFKLVPARDSKLAEIPGDLRLS